MRIRSSFVEALALALAVPLIVHAAGIFPDVPDSHPYAPYIATMVRSGVVKGYADGTFKPDTAVVRAELLTMLYRATGKTPKPGQTCFNDVVAGSWYADIVCDAASRDNYFVQGYNDGSFGPEKQVSRTEALAMMYKVMKLDTPNLSDDDARVIKFTDTSNSAWYSKYLRAAFAHSILPLPTLSGVRFYPEQALLRGEAAALITKGLEALAKQTNPATNPAGSSRSSTARGNNANTAASSSASAAFNSKSVNFPFTDSGTFDKKQSMSYLFSPTTSGGKAIVNVNVKIVGFYPSAVTCRLYLVDADGFTTEYYLGVQDTSDTCSIVAAVRPGNYQFQIQPDRADVSYQVTGAYTTGDGNDGFVEAVNLALNVPRTNILNVNDVYDVYSFTVKTAGQYMVEVLTLDKSQCVVYVPKDYDQYGFKGPECNVYYDYQPGTYQVVLPHRDSLLKKQPYTIKWRT